MCIDTERRYTFDDLCALIRDKKPYWRAHGYLYPYIVSAWDDVETATYDQKAYDHVQELERDRLNQLERMGNAQRARWASIKAGLPKPPEKVKEYKKVNGFVYLIECGGVFKIGKAIDVERRAAYFGIVLPFEPHVIHKIASDDYTRAELQMHERFKEKRTRGEWFALSAEDVEEIKRIETL